MITLLTESYGLEAAEKLGIAPEKVFKTLVITDGKELFVGIVPVTSQLSLKLSAFIELETLFPLKIR